MDAGRQQRRGGCAGADGDLYAVLGLKKECSAADLRSAYKKLALRWHPDRCSSSGSSKTVDEAKSKFQAIQEAYSVLSDTNKRFMYDVGVYDDDDDDATGMGAFLGEMVTMMSQANPSQGRSDTFEELQKLFVEMFQADMDAFCCRGTTADTASASSRARRSTHGCDRPSTSSATFSTATTTAASLYGVTRPAGQKRDGAEMCSGKAKAAAACDGAAAMVGSGATFCFGAHDGNGSSAASRGRAGCGGGNKRRGGRRPKASSRQGTPPSHEDGETVAVAE